MAEFKKVNAKNIREIDGICTLINVERSDEVIEFFNEYVVKNNIEKYATVSKNGIVYSYDVATNKHTKIGVQKEGAPRIYAVNPHYTEYNVPVVEEYEPEIDWQAQAKMLSDSVRELEEQIANKIVRIQELENRLNDVANTETYQPSMQECVDRLIEFGYTVALSKIQ